MHALDLFGRKVFVQFALEREHIVRQRFRTGRILGHRRDHAARLRRHLRCGNPQCPQHAGSATPDQFTVWANRPLQPCGRSPR